MPLKRVTPSFTVEYRQTKRLNTGSAKLGWAHAKLAPAGVDEAANRIAISAFKTVAAHPLAAVISPSILPGRILPSLIETAPVTVGGAQSKSHGSASKAAETAQVLGDGTVARHFGEHAYRAEDLEPSVGSFRLEQPATSPFGADRVTTPGSKKRTRRPAERQGKLDNAPRRSADSSDTAPVSSTSSLPPISKPSSTTRTSRILDRYVFRDERGPGESWKHRIESRRERRAQAPVSAPEPIESE
jgi:hypothetical protein